jgi:hypothetical protein
MSELDDHLRAAAGIKPGLPAVFAQKRRQNDPPAYRNIRIGNDSGGMGSNRNNRSGNQGGNMPSGMPSGGMPSGSQMPGRN